jgi:uroporphyrin-III C-methyltransferase / precorrin-2 dehydrogenase / sirohydrochlorin ferrochelatase
VTGHAKSGDIPADLDWKGLADPAATLVIYMGGQTGAAIAARLVSVGLPATTPCVVATSVSRRREVTRAGTLGDIATGVLACASDAPVLIGVGRIFADAAVAPASATERAAACG